MARISSAAELKEVLNWLSPEEALGAKADVEKMHNDGLTSLTFLTSIQPETLQSYGVPAFQTGHLQQLAKDASAGKKRLHQSSHAALHLGQDSCQKMHVPGLCWLVLSALICRFSKHLLPIPSPVMYLARACCGPGSIRRFCDGNPHKGRVRMARIMAGLALGAIILSAVYYMVNIVVMVVEQ